MAMIGGDDKQDILALTAQALHGIRYFESAAIDAGEDSAMFG